ncbi:MAG: hypothetical protein U1E28_22895 [Beijerinckiaceae bacterium]
MSVRFVAPTLIAAFASLAFAGAANAQANVMTECGKQYQAAKAANQLAGKSWNQYLAECRTRVSAQPAAAAPAAPATAPANPLKPAPAATAPAPAAAPAAAAKPAAGGRAAENARIKACGAEWKAKKAELQKADPTLKWPKYWSECNTRMKAAGQ